MPGPILHLGAVVTCSHGGPAQPVAPFPRVLVAGQPVVTLASPYVVAGCPFVPKPCLTGQWVAGAVRVLAGGIPVAVQAGVSTCAPNGTPMLPLFAQPRVVAT